MQHGLPFTNVAAWWQTEDDEITVRTLDDDPITLPRTSRYQAPNGTVWVFANCWDYAEPMYLEAHLNPADFDVNGMAGLGELRESVGPLSVLAGFLAA